MRYGSPARAAGNVRELVAYLKENSNSRCLYRGQVQPWPAPLVPSAFRRYNKTGATYTCASAEYAHALRQAGRLFVGLVPVNYFHESIALFYPRGAVISSAELELLQKLSNDQYVARSMAAGEEWLDLVLTPLETAIFRDRLPLWTQVISHDHRVQIRDMVFMRPFGYLLGQGLAQQYGFSSEMLDVTSDVDVAAFFATRCAPGFVAVPTEGVGVIYRFFWPEEPKTPLDLGAYDFYSCPSTLSVDSLLGRFCVDSAERGAQDSVEDFLVRSFEEFHTWRRWEDFRVHRDVLERTRIARQHAAFIVPDMILVETGVRPRASRLMMAVEDCATRDGAEAFYFQHTPESRESVELTREYLWPNGADALFEMIGRALLASVVLETSQILPSRIDLLDAGYAA